MVKINELKQENEILKHLLNGEREKNEKLEKELNHYKNLSNEFCKIINVKVLKKVESLMNINTIHRQIELQKSGRFYDNFNEDV